MTSWQTVKREYCHEQMMKNFIKETFGLNATIKRMQ